MKAKEDLQDLIEQISSEDSPVGMDAVYVHALILDRLTMLETAWGDQHPVRDQITSELRANTARTFGIDPALLADMSLEALLDARAAWDARLGA